MAAEVKMIPAVEESARNISAASVVAAVEVALVRSRQDSDSLLFGSSVDNVLETPVCNTTGISNVIRFAVFLTLLWH